MSWTQTSIIAMPTEAFLQGPHINWQHIDGPLMSWAGHLHWLTWTQRVSLRFGIKTVNEIACERWPHLAAKRAELEIGK